MKLKIRDQLFRIWYWYVNKVDRKAEILFMNYGFHGEEQDTNEELQSPDRFSIQLYDHLATAIDLKGLDVVEIGSGRGGGLFHVKQKHAPASAQGIELDKRAVNFCNTHYKDGNLTFSQGDAQSLKLEDESSDVVLNVESSHRYQDMATFLKETERVLRPGGHLLLTDFRYDHEMDDFKQLIAKSGLQVVREKNINREVLAALNLDDQRKRKLVKKLVPAFLHKVALNFAGTIGSTTYKNLESGKYVYFSYVLKKQDLQ
ncbi:class I SAM-dependent methyltransferase [Salinivirga cyanobacteriivorans]